MKTPPEYQRSASILIKDENKGGNIGAAADVISNLGFFQSRVNIQNELLAIQAPIIIRETIKDLHLNEKYTVQEGLRFQDLYKISPIEIAFPEKKENDNIKFVVSVNSPDDYELVEIWHNDVQISDAALSGKFGETLQTPLGSVVITTTPYMNEAYVDRLIYYSNIPVLIAADRLAGKLKFDLGNKTATIIEISIVDASTLRADDIINTVIRLYGEAWIKDKNQIAQSTSEFINERLILIERELGNVDEDISTYKSKNLLPDAQAVSNKYLEQSSKNDAQILQLNTQYSIAKFIKEYMHKESRLDQLIPANSGIDTKIENQIAEYNTLLLERNSLVANSSKSNPLVTNIDQSLLAMRNAIAMSIDDLISIVGIQLDKVVQSELQTQQKISKNPTQVKYLLSVERQQKIKETLYLFLLQKREENELTYAFTAYNTRIISPPMGSIIPVYPSKVKVLLFAVLLALVIPGFILLIIETLNTTVKSRKDLSILSLPIIGDIPWVGKRSFKTTSVVSRRKKLPLKIIVNGMNRDRVNEAFRIVRTNIDFMLDDENKNSGAVIMATSANPDSGKTFVIANLAISMSIRGSKVLVVDLDLRKATISSIVGNPTKGVVDFLAGKQKNLGDLVVKSEKYANVDVLPVGKTPPNPSELLSGPRLKELIAEVKSNYDYILIDCTPIDIVADAAIVNKVVDMTIFVIRAGLYDRRDLPYIQELYDQQVYNKMRVVLNNSDMYGKYNYYNKYGYGRYGYISKDK